MEQDELKQLSNVAKKCCDTWIEILGLQRWSISIKIVDNIDDDIPLLPILCEEVASVQMFIPTGEVWKNKFPDFWAPYVLDTHIVAQLLAILFPEADPTYRYYIARILSHLEDRCNILQHMLEEQSEQEDTEQPQAVEDPGSDTDKPELDTDEPEIDVIS